MRSTIANSTASNDTIAKFLMDNGLNWRVRGGIESATTSGKQFCGIGLGRGIQGAGQAVQFGPGAVMVQRSLFRSRKRGRKNFVAHACGTGIWSGLKTSPRSRRPDSMETRAVYPATLEIRQRSGGGRTLSGRFPYGKKAVVRDRGTTRKESIQPGAFKFSVEDAEREIHLLFGHDYNRPLARKLNGSLKLKDTPKELRFDVTLPDAAARPSWMEDAIKSVRSGLVSGLSPGFVIPPSRTVPNALKLRPEPGNESVMIREVYEASLLEISIVARPAYREAGVELRHRGERPCLLHYR